MTIKVRPRVSLAGRLQMSAIVSNLPIVSVTCYEVWSQNNINTRVIEFWVKSYSYIHEQIVKDQTLNVL